MVFTDNIAKDFKFQLILKKIEILKKKMRVSMKLLQSAITLKNSI